MNDLTKTQIVWLFGSVLTGIIALMVVPVASVSYEVINLDSIEGQGFDAPKKERFDIIYWPLHVLIVLMWVVTIVFKAPEEPDVKVAMWKMIGVYGVLVFFSYFMHVAGKNYVISHTDGINKDKNLQMAAILATFTIVIYITGSVAAVISLIAGRKDPEEESLVSKLANKLRKNNEIERWPSKIDRISAMYEQLIEGSIRTPAERTRMRKALVASLKNVHTFKEAYHILQSEADKLNLHNDTRQQFLVQCTDIIAETDDNNTTPSIFSRIMNIVKPAGPATAGPAKTMPEFIETLFYEGSYFVIEVVDLSAAPGNESIIIPQKDPIKNSLTYKTNKPIEKGKTQHFELIKN